MFTQPTNHSARFGVCWPTKNEHVRKQPTLLDNTCWPTFVCRVSVTCSNI